MLSGVLNSPKAVQVNIEIMRAFVRLRQMLLSHIELARKIEAMEKKYDSQFKVVFDALRALILIGFNSRAACSVNPIYRIKFVTLTVHRAVIVTNNGIYAVPYLMACCEVVDWPRPLSRNAKLGLI
jgi:hypothetical protein